MSDEKIKGVDLDSLRESTSRLGSEPVRDATPKLSEAEHAALEEAWEVLANAEWVGTAMVPAMVRMSIDENGSLEVEDLEVDELAVAHSVLHTNQDAEEWRAAHELHKQILLAKVDEIAEREGCLREDILREIR
jgi:hypothetical protein